MKRTEDTDRLIASYKNAKRLDLDRLFASGIDVMLYDYSDPEGEKFHMDRTTIAGEDFKPVKDALVEVLAIQIRKRIESLTRQLRDCEEALGIKPTQSE